uniref:Uncharacterized protein n=1 Tax=Anguilla anguilla TaxID=7936 RepID=A0A0E9T8R8_ANGAN
MCCPEGAGGLGVVIAKSVNDELSFLSTPNSRQMRK